MNLRNKKVNELIQPLRKNRNKKAQIELNTEKEIHKPEASTSLQSSNLHLSYSTNSSSSENEEAEANDEDCTTIDQSNASASEASESDSNKSDLIEKILTKRKRALFKEIDQFSSQADLDNYIRTQNFYFVKITHNERVNCSVCEYQHKMIKIYMKCTCKNCNLKLVSN